MSYTCPRCGTKLRAPAAGDISSTPREPGGAGHTRERCLTLRLAQANAQIIGPGLAAEGRPEMTP